MQHRNLTLYLLVLTSIAGIVAIALGGGLWGQHQPWVGQWQHRVFQPFCHQIPERSFWIAGQPMAVCSRCIGIYIGFALGWMSLSLLSRANLFSWLNRKHLLIGAIAINLIDLAGNFVGLWQNTLLSRLVLGVALGLAAAIIFLGSFFNRKIKNTGIHHGRIKSTGI